MEIRCEDCGFVITDAEEDELDESCICGGKFKKE